MQTTNPITQAAEAAKIKAWIHENIAAVTVAATVCSSSGHDHTAKVLNTMAQEMRDLVRLRSALRKVKK